MQKHLDFLTEKYSVGKTVKLTEGCKVSVNGRIYPLLPWRAERRFTELKKLVTDGEINGISVMRSLRIVKRGSDLYEQLFREIDLCRYILNTEIREIFVVGDEKYALNVSAATADGYVCTLELSATLGENDPMIDKHEIIAQSGVACDRAADTQIPQSSVYVFGNGQEQTYTDTDDELFGLNTEQCALVRAAFETAKTEHDLSGDISTLHKIISCAKQSLANTENVFIEG